MDSSILVTPNLGLVIWTALLFAIVVIVVGRFAVKPLAEALKARENSIAEQLNAAAKAKEDILKISKDNEKLLQQAREERDSILKEAQARASKTLSDAQESAKAESNRIITAAQEAIQNEKNAALAEVKNQVAVLSIEVAEKILRGQLENKDNQKKFVADLLKDVKVN